MSKQILFAVILWSAIAVLTATAAVAETGKFPEPTGFGKAKFGMGVAEVRKLYPTVHPTKGTEEAVQKGEQAVLVYEMDNQRVGPLKPCQAQLRFFQGELYEVQFRCPDRAKVGEYLQKTYGEPTKVTEKAVFWMGQQSAVSLAPRTGAFGFSDLERTKAMQAFVFAQLQKVGVGEPPATAATAEAPGATPTPAEAPAAAPEAAPAPAEAPAAAPQQ